MAFLVGTDPGLRQTRVPTVDAFVAGVGFTAGSSTTVTLSDDPGQEAHVIISFDGITQHRTTYSVSGATVTFDAVIPSGVASVEATFAVTVASTTVPDLSVTTGKIVTNAVDETLIKDAFVADFTEVVVAAGDSILLGDATDSGNTKRDTVQGILDLVPAAGITLGTDTATTSGSAWTWTGIPSGTKRITIMFQDFSPSATSKLKVTIGDAGGLETSGYTGMGMYTQNTSGGQVASTTYFIINMSESAGGEILNGHCVLTLKDAATYEWSQSHVLQMSGQGGMFGGGTKALSAELTQVSVSLVAGTGDAGSINISYE